MVAKIMGLATGALLASVAVWIFNDWRTVTDEERLLSTLSDHCLPYVQTGATPFEGSGRSPGVYDNINLDDTLTEGGARIVFDNRFIAEWGIAPVTENNIAAERICKVSPTYVDHANGGFFVADDGLIDTINAAIASDGALVTGFDSVPNGPTSIAWLEPGKTETEGLRVFMTAGGGVVPVVIVANDYP